MLRLKLMSWKGWRPATYHDRHEGRLWAEHECHPLNDAPIAMARS
jgi:hypothetical protein